MNIYHVMQPFPCGVRMRFVKKYLICGEEGAVEAVLGFFNVDFW